MLWTPEFLRPIISGVRSLTAYSTIPQIKYTGDKIYCDTGRRIKSLRRTFLPLNSEHPEATPLKLHSCACAVRRYVRAQRHCELHTRYKEAVLALEMQVSCSQRTRKKCVLARQLIGLSILHINQQDRQLYMTILHTHAQTSLHVTYTVYSTPKL